jgi:hypothetical protein
MGRYAFFNTDLEYKFRFGIQSSSDIRRFAGIYRWDLSKNGYLVHEWEHKDMELIYKELESIVFNSKIEMPDFEKYESDIHGTYELRWDLEKLYEDPMCEEEARILAMFILGSLIYHQLLYKEKLTAHYET